MKEKTEAFARALQTVIGGRLKQSGLGAVWYDEQTWQELATKVITALAGDIVIVERGAYNKLVAEAKQMGVVRNHITAYQSLLSKGRTT